MISPVPTTSHSTVSPYSAAGWPAATLLPGTIGGVVLAVAALVL
jgi:hypothetical protein